MKFLKLFNPRPLLSSDVNSDVSGIFICLLGLIWSILILMIAFAMWDISIMWVRVFIIANILWMVPAYIYNKDKK